MANTIDISGRKLVFKISGADKFLSIKSRLVIPLSHVKSVSTQRAKWWRNLSELRIGGARIPNIVKDGRYLSRGKFYFYVMHDPDRCVTIDLNNELYSAIIFQVADKEAMARKIRAKIKGS